MPTSMALFQALLAASVLIVPTHADITTSWTVVGCDTVGAVNGAGGTTFGGYTIDQLYSGAASMASYAQTRIAVATAAPKIVSKTDEARAADNGKYMFAASFKFTKKIIGGLFSGSGLPAASINTLSTVNGVFQNIVTLMNAPNNGYFFCSGANLVFGIPPGGVYQTDVWYYNIPNTDPPDAVVLTFTIGSDEDSRPCVGGNLAGKTFRGTNATGVLTILGVLFCSNQLPATWPGLLTEGETVSSDNPNPDDYKSGAQTILHEMVHCLGDQYQDILDPTLFTGEAYGYDKCYLLAQNNLPDALVNADNYAVFAAMSYMSGTRWGAPPSAPATSRRGLQFDMGDDWLNETYPQAAYPGEGYLEAVQRLEAEAEAEAMT